MRRTDEFDALYAETRSRLLLQTFALTGDLAASARAVRDAYVTAWHHWNKVGRRDDQEAWLRDVAWSSARLRHTARIWHRDKQLSEEAKEILGALGKLTGIQRRVLLLNRLAAVSVADLGHEVRVVRAVAEQALQSAATSYAATREIAATDITTDLQQLAEAIDDSRLPRAPLLRRAGTTRRRVFTLVGVAATAGVLLGAGTLVADKGGVAPHLTTEAAPPMITPAPRTAPRLVGAEMLEPSQFQRIAPRLRWTAAAATGNTTGTGLYSTCQGARYADNTAIDALVRTYTGRGGRYPLSGVQATELSHTVRAARRTLGASQSWYARCQAPNVLLLDTYDISRVGDEAKMFVLQVWGAKPSFQMVALARSGQAVTTVIANSPISLPPRRIATTLAAAVNRLCGTPGTATCAGPPQVAPAPPMRGSTAPGLLDSFDLPQPGNVNTFWTGSDPEPMARNNATTACNEATTFTGNGFTNSVGRNYVMVRGNLPTSFGITETAGVLPSEERAAQFVNAVRTRLGNCERDDLATTVAPGFDTGQRDGNQLRDSEYAIWRVASRVSETAQVDVMMAIIRNGAAVAEIGFVTARGAEFTDAQFQRLVERARDRLVYLG